MKHLILKSVFISLLLCITFNAIAQSNTETKELKIIVIMKNGQEYKGVLIRKDSSTIHLKTQDAEIKLNTANIKSIEYDSYTGKFNFANSHDTRYFFAPSAIPLKKGKGYYQNILVTSNFVNYGITDNIAIGGGIEFISTALGHPIWFLSPKVGFKASKNLHVSGGILVAGISTLGFATLIYGTTTYGTSETNITAGVGYGFIGGELSKYPAITVSGTHRVSNSIALLSENYILPNAESPISYTGIHGVRVIAKKNAFDFGVILIPKLPIFLVPVLPYVGYVRTF